jgi:hypothetical protein
VARVVAVLLLLTKYVHGVDNRVRRGGESGGESPELGAVTWFPAGAARYVFPLRHTHNDRPLESPVGTRIHDPSGELLEHHSAQHSVHDEPGSSSVARSWGGTVQYCYSPQERWAKVEALVATEELLSSGLDGVPICGVWRIGAHAEASRSDGMRMRCGAVRCGGG